MFTKSKDIGIQAMQVMHSIHATECRGDIINPAMSMISHENIW